MSNKQKLAAVALLLVACAVSFTVGYNINNSRHYEAACRMADVIHCYNDYLIEDTTSQDYGYFEEVQGVFLLDEDPIDMTQYSWAY
jgi:hypothetical protein